MKKILVLEDDLVAMMLYGELFKKKEDEYKLIKCFNGIEALKKIRAEKPNLILMDLHMPLVSGFDVYNEIKSDKDISSIPIIIVTADMGARNKYNKKLTGVTWLLKPIMFDELFGAINKTLVSSSVNV